MKLKKSIQNIFIIITILLLGLIMFWFREKQYEVKYKVDGYEITETYRNEGVYTFETEMENQKYRLSIFNDKNIKKKVINHVKTYKSDEYSCLYFVSKYIETYPICTNENKEFISYTLIEDVELENFYQSKDRNDKKDNYENISIKSLDENILIWNYKGYHYLKKDGTYKTINFLNSETYYNEHAFQMGKYLFTPNYDEKYEFTTFNVIDMTTGKNIKLKTDYQLSYNYYILGVKDSRGYLIDQKNKKQYEITLDKLKVTDITKNGYGKVWTGEWEEISMTKLINHEYSFDNELYKNFIVENEKIFSVNAETKIKTLLSNRNINQIIHIKNDKVYYLSKDKLYYFCPHYGEEEVATYTEWNFNTSNQIFIY